MEPLWKQEQRLDYLESNGQPTCRLERVAITMGLVMAVAVSAMLTITAVAIWLW